MVDWSFSSLESLLNSFNIYGYKIQAIQNIFQSLDSSKTLILRHDVDRFPMNTLKMARMEAEMGIVSTYYFRIVPAVFKPKIIKEVAALGHEIGYHYEDLSICKGNLEESIAHFKKNLARLREFYPVSTICMHGSPLSKWDNKTLWQHYSYKDYGIIADTSLDIDYNDVFYISDNGRAWNRTGVSVRDKVETHFNIPIKSTQHLIELIQEGKMPQKVMLNAHPDTFFDFGIKYILNWGFIETKNIAKWFIVRYGLRK